MAERPHTSATSTAAGHVTAIVGAGLVGSGWAIVFARAGHVVRVFDPKPEIRERLLPQTRRSITALEKAGLIDDGASVMGRIAVVDTLVQALDGASYVQESVFETVEAKAGVSQTIDAAMEPEAIVGSSSSGIPASRFTEACKHRDRFLIAHPVNPPHLMPVVELVPAPWTDPAVVDRARTLMDEVGQVPVALSREIDGFILNRLQGALLNEAWALYDEGYASLSDIDATVAHGLGLRWAFMGPFETIDLNAPDGIADYASRLGELYYSIATQRAAKRWPAETIDKAETERRRALAATDLAGRQDWRDGVLTRLAAFKKANGLTG